MSLQVKQIGYKDCLDLILNVHYAKRVPSISYAYGLFDDEEMIGIVTYGSPASPFLCKGVCGEQFKSEVIELNRLVLKHNEKNQASYLISKSMKLLPKPKIIVSYADTAYGHQGLVYQASNFLFTGTTKPRTDMASENGKHSRHSLGDRTQRVFRSSKHRYVFFIGSKFQKKIYLESLKYPIQTYPK